MFNNYKNDVKCNPKIDDKLCNFPTLKLCRFSMILTDTHTHLYSEEFDQDRAQMIQRAIDAGVSRFFVPSIDSAYTQKMYDLEAQFPENVFLMMGLHPCYVKPETYLLELAHVEA